MANMTFQTRARTIDHLGREQIADTPTAISELWKNSYDAYAQHVSLNIVDGRVPMASLLDDGHGMDRDEFVEKWLTVGTESKVSGKTTLAADRNGLPVRQTLGQKGIGRLSCANLGPVLLIISKRKKKPFVVSMLDWRLFENPYLNLSDIKVPVLEFDDPRKLGGLLPRMVAEVRSNIEPGSKQKNSELIRDAWQKFDKSENARNASGRSYSKDICRSLDEFTLDPRCLQNWKVWKNSEGSGTAMVVSDVSFDLAAQIGLQPRNPTERASRDRFFETLSSFVDPFFNPARPERVLGIPDFSYEVRVWEEETSRVALGIEQQFDFRQIESLEHQIDGWIDDEGVFRGKIRAFGRNLEDECLVNPPADITVPKKGTGKIGKFHIYVAAMEFDLKNSSHSDIEFQETKKLAEKYAGFMLYRDGLRVLPFGRPDNDFFGIEERRTKHTGREYWNKRQMFGRVAISTHSNPNLRDKAGREGLIDNPAAKVFKALVVNVLKVTARRYFGSDSEVRKEVLPTLQAEYNARKAEEDRRKHRKNARQRFRRELTSALKKLEPLAAKIEKTRSSASLKSMNSLLKASDMVFEIRDELRDIEIASVPKDFAGKAEDYRDYRDRFEAARRELREFDEEIVLAEEQLNNGDPLKVLERRRSDICAAGDRRLKRWQSEIGKLQRNESQRILDLINQRKSELKEEASAVLARWKIEQLSFADAMSELDDLSEVMEFENSKIFGSYMRAIESFQESIDLDLLVSFGAEELTRLEQEVDRLNALAQLGIAVEISGHELQYYDQIIGAGLRELPVSVRQTRAYKDIELGYQGITDQIRFLSPLRLAGQRIKDWISGEEIFEYVHGFFAPAFKRNEVSFEATARFKSIRVFDYKSRIIPVFVNLVDNSIYWLSTSKNTKRKIVLDFVNDEVVISDNGPGVEPEDQVRLFTLFFTRKSQGGRGVGLYIANANLVAGGHKIRFEPNSENMPLNGANFAIKFTGIEFDV